MCDMYGLLRLCQCSQEYSGPPIMNSPDSEKPYNEFITLDLSINIISYPNSFIIQKFYCIPIYVVLR